MANRFPLVLDTTDNNKIKEIQTGDNLNLADNSIVGVQNITALGTINAADIKVNGNRLTAQTFADLTDTPSTFVGSPNYFVKVKADGTGLEYKSLSDLGNIQIATITVDTSIVPTTDNVGNIGTEVKKFNEIVGTTLKGNLVSYAEEIVFNATTGKISYAALQGAPAFLSEFADDVGYLRTTDLDTTLAGLFDAGQSFVTDIVGSVFGDDSTVLVDGTDGLIKGNIQSSVGTITTLTSSQLDTTGVKTVTLQGNTSHLYVKGGGSAYDVVIGDVAQAETKEVKIYNAVVDGLGQGSGLGIAQISTSTDLEITAGNRVKINGGVPFKFSSIDATNQLAIAAQEGDVIYNTTTSRLQMYQGSAWKDVNGNVEATAGTSNFNNVVIAGNFTVTGTTTNVETTNTNITDNVITLNQGESGAGVTLGTAGIEIERGTSTNKTLVWNETTDKWTVGAETFVAATFEGGFTGIIGGATPAAVTGTTITANTGFVGNVTGNAAGAHTGTFDGDMTGTMSGDDSTILVDGINNKVVGVVDTTSIRTSEDRIALGKETGVTNQAYGGIAIGPYSGRTDQDARAVAVGTSAGRNSQGTKAVAIGDAAGYATQGTDAVAIGVQAGETSQGESAIAIGKLAGFSNQAANSIVLNATGSTVENTTASSTVIQPVRNQASANVMMYNPANGELTHTATPGTLAANIDQATLAIGAASATVIGIGNAASTTTISGILSVPAVVSGNITADNSMSITTATGDGNSISIGPGGTNRAVNLTADVIRISGDVIVPIVAKAGVVGDLKGSVVGDDSTVLIDGVGSKIVGPIASADIAGTLVKATTIENNTTDDLAVNVDGFININAGTDDPGMSKIQMDKTGTNYVEITTEPQVPGNAADVANVAIQATANSGDVVIGTTGSTRNQEVTIYNATVTGSLIGNALGAHAGTFDGDMTGSLYGDDSTVMVDGVAGKIVGPISRIVGDVQQISGPGVISLDTLVTEITTTGADAYTLADSVVGQIKIIAMIVDGGDATLTPTTLATGTTITFNDINDNITLLYTTNGWVNTANQGAVIA
jgi:hypothetical protein